MSNKGTIPTVHIYVLYVKAIHLKRKPALLFNDKSEIVYATIRYQKDEISYMYQKVWANII